LTRSAVFYTIDLKDRLVGWELFAITSHTKPSSRDTRESALRAAAACFAEKGYAETGVAEICSRAGISRGALYYHFESKQAIFLELVDRQLVELIEDLENTARDAVNIPENLLRLTHLIQGLIQSDSTRAGIFLEAWSQASRDGSMRKASLGTFDHFEAIFTRLIQRGIDEGTFAPIDPAVGARALLAITSGIFMRGLLEPQKSDWGKVAEESIKVLIQGMKRRSIE